MFDCEVTTFSTGGSSGEDRLTSNGTFSYKRCVIHLQGIAECRNLDTLIGTLDLSPSEFESLHALCAAASKKTGNDADSVDHANTIDSVEEEKIPQLQNVAPGFTLDYTKGGRATFTQWGATINWSPANHKVSFTFHFFFYSQNGNLDLPKGIQGHRTHHDDVART